MTPKEKAKELIEKYCQILFDDVQIVNISSPIRCALIAVDEIINSFNAFMDSRKNFRHELEIDAERYWQKVKEEIQDII